MANPTMGWLVLRRAAKERPPQQSDERKWIKFGVHRQAFSSESQVGFEISQRVATMAASEAANGKCRLDETTNDELEPEMAAMGQADIVWAEMELDRMERQEIRAEEDGGRRSPCAPRKGREAAPFLPWTISRETTIRLAHSSRAKLEKPDSAY